MTEQTVIVPSDPETRERLKKAIVDISNQWAIIEGHQAVVKEGIKSISEDYELPSKFISKLARAYHRQNFSSQQTEFEEFTDLYDAIIGGQS